MRLFVSKSEFDRNISAIVKGAETVRTITFPGTVKEVQGRAFEKNEWLRAVVLNEGLEKLEESRGYDRCGGALGRTKIKKVALPTTLRVLGGNVFHRCRELKSVIFQETSALEKIGRYCFSESGIEKIAIPKTVKTIGADAFEKCKDLKAICVDGNSELSLSYIGITNPVGVVRSRETMAWEKPLLELRELKEVVIPEGSHAIGNYWFWGSSVESVTIPSNVKRIGVEAFYDCK